MQKNVALIAVSRSATVSFLISHYILHFGSLIVGIESVLLLMFFLNKSFCNIVDPQSNPMQGNSILISFGTDSLCMFQKLIKSLIVKGKFCSTLFQIGSIG